MKARRQSDPTKPRRRTSDLSFEVTTTTSVEEVHALAVPGEGAPETQLGLHWVDQLPIRALVSSDPTAVLEHARALAAALCGPGHDAARLRLLARSIAVARTQMSLLEGMLLERLAKRDDGGVESTDKALRSVTSRLVKLIEAHRLESSQQRRVSVVVAHANEVRVEGGE